MEILVLKGLRCRIWQYYFLICIVISLSGESDDDHEELYVAANSARNASSMLLDLLVHTQSLTALYKSSIFLLHIHAFITKVLPGFCRTCKFWPILEENGISFWFSQLRGHILLTAAGIKWVP